MRLIAVLGGAVFLLWAGTAFAEPGSPDLKSPTGATTALTDQAPGCSRADGDDDCTQAGCEASRDDGDENSADDDSCPPPQTCDSSKDDADEDEGCPPPPCQASKDDDDEDEQDACPPPTCQSAQDDNDSSDNHSGDDDSSDNHSGDDDSSDRKSDDSDSDDDDTENCPPTYPPGYPTYPPQCPPKDDGNDDNGDMENCPPTYPPPCDKHDDDNGHHGAPTYPCKDDENGSDREHGHKHGKHKSPPRIAGRKRTKSVKVGKDGKFMLSGVTVACPGDGGKCSVAATSDGAAGARKARAAVVLATVKFSLRAGRSSEVQMQLTKEGKRLLVNKGRMTLVTQLSAVQANGAPVTRTFKTSVTAGKPAHRR